MLEFDTVYEVQGEELVITTEFCDGQMLNGWWDDPSGWKLWSYGMSNQDSYDGAIFHDSEYLSDDILEKMIAEGGKYCLLAAYWDDEISGWFIVRSR